MNLIGGIGSMLRFLFAAAIAAILSPASASFYNVDLFGSDFAVPGTGGITTLNVCRQSGLVCAKEQQSAVFQFQPGDTVDFGQLTLRSNAIPNISGTTYITPFVDVVFNAPLQPTPPFGNYSGGICINPAVPHDDFRSRLYVAGRCEQHSTDVQLPNCQLRRASAGTRNMDIAGRWIRPVSRISLSTAASSETDKSAATDPAGHGVMNARARKSQDSGFVLSDAGRLRIAYPPLR